MNYKFLIKVGKSADFPLIDNMNDTKKNVIKTKSYKFALDIIQLNKKLVGKREYVLSRQLLKAGTSIGANVEEALVASSRKDFTHKMSIASREARESCYWLRLLRDSNYLEEDEACSLLETADELIRILTAIVKTSGESM